MFLAWLLLLTGLTISAVAIYYSVIGLAAIFAAATIPIYIMGGSLEVAKLVCASWLKANWHRTPALMKWYMTTAVVVLMLITSMGIFGFLSKAHSDQGLVSGDVQSKLAVYDEKIKNERDNIDAARKALNQMDAQVNERLSRSNDDAGAERAVQIRRQQQAERTRLQKDITTAQNNINRLNEERAPIAAQVRKVEAEVGPIKYIAALIYGENTDTNLLEKAVTWVIIVIVSVFDPLAVIMLLAAQMSFAWAREQKRDEYTPDPYVADVGEKPTKEELQEELQEKPIEKEMVVNEKTHPYLYKGDFWKKPEGWPEVGPMVYKPEPAQFKDSGEHPKDTFGYEAPEPEPVVETAPEPDPITVASAEVKVDEPTYKILPELEESKKKVYDQTQGSANSQDQTVTYVQNSEQTEETLWQRLQKKKDELKPIDRLYKEYSRDEFKDLNGPEDEPELVEFINRTKERGPRFNNYNSEKLEYFARRIYELRKDQSNHST